MEYYSGTTGEALRDIELREIVIESGRSVKNQWHKLAVFLLAFYLPFAIFTCVVNAIIRARSHEYVAWKATSFGPQGPFGKPDNVGPSFHTDHPTLLFICGPLLTLIYLVLYYLLQASTILVVGAPFESKSDSQWTPRTILTASFDRAWRMYLTDLLTSIIVFIAIFLYVLILMISLRFFVGNITLESDMIQLETLLLLVWVVHFILTVSLVRPVATIERLWGMAAIKRSAALLRGRKMTTITVLIFFTVCGIIDNILQTIFMTGPKWVLPLGFTLSLSIVIFMYLLITTVSTVFYFSCRSVYNDQGLDLAAFQPIPQSASMLMRPENGL